MVTAAEAQNVTSWHPAVYLWPLTRSLVVGGCKITFNNWWRTSHLGYHFGGGYYLGNK